MLESLDLPTDDVLGATTVNIGTVRAGTEANIVPALDRAYVWVDYDHKIVGRISWTTSNITPSACTVGGDGCPCLHPSGVGSANCKTWYSTPSRF